MLNGTETGRTTGGCEVEASARVLVPYVCDCAVSDRREPLKAGGVSGKVELRAVTMQWDMTSQRR